MSVGPAVPADVNTCARRGEPCVRPPLNRAARTGDSPNGERAKTSFAPTDYGQHLKSANTRLAPTGSGRHSRSYARHCDPFMVRPRRRSQSINPVDATVTSPLGSGTSLYRMISRLLPLPALRTSVGEGVLAEAWISI